MCGTESIEEPLVLVRCYNFYFQGETNALSMEIYIETWRKTSEFTKLQVLRFKKDMIDFLLTQETEYFKETGSLKIKQGASRIKKLMGRFQTDDFFFFFKWFYTYYVT